MRALRVMVAVVALPLLVFACAPSASPGPSGRASLHAAPSATPTVEHSRIPAFVDVPEYRGDTARSGVYPGPGPIAKPELVWSRSVGELEFAPILVDGVFLVGAIDGHLDALDARTGDARWRFPASGSVEAITGYASAADGVVVVPIAGGLQALDLATGAKRWSAPGAAGAITDIVDGIVYSAARDGHAYGLDLQTGRVVWSWVAPSAASYVTVDGGIAYISVEDGRVYAISLETKSELWHLQTISQAGAAVVGPDVVFVSARGDQGEIYAVERTTGQLRWKYRPPSGLGMSLGAIGDGVFYSGSVGDGMFAFPITPPPGQIRPVWHAEDTGSIVKNADLVDGILYVPVAEPHSLVAIDAADGTILWRLPLEGLAQAPVVSGGMLFTTDDTGVVSAWAEPWLKGLIGQTVSGPLVPPEPSGPTLSDPFEIVATFDWATTGVKTPWMLDVGPNGLLYALDAKPSVVVLDPASGKHVDSLGQPGHGRRRIRPARIERQPWLGRTHRWARWFGLRRRCRQPSRPGLRPRRPLPQAIRDVRDRPGPVLEPESRRRRRRRQHLRGRLRDDRHLEVRPRWKRAVAGEGAVRGGPESAVADPRRLGPRRWSPGRVHGGRRGRRAARSRGRQVPRGLGAGPRE